MLRKVRVRRSHSKQPFNMEREESPDWLRDFKSPTEDVMILSSSPSPSSSETPENVKESPEVSPKKEIPDDSSLLAASGEGKTGKGAVPKDGTSKKRGRPPGSKNKKVKEKASPTGEEVLPEDDDERGEKLVSSRRAKGGKKSVDNDGDDQELKPPTKVRKTAAAKKVKKEGAETPKSSRKNKRVSLPEDDETPILKKVKRELELGSVKAEVGEDEENDDETVPISKLSAARKTPGQSLPEPASADADAVFKASDRPSTSALRALVGDQILNEDGLDLSQVGLSQDLLAAEETGELAERKPKRISSTLPVIFAEKIHRTKVLLECEDDGLDLSGDMGAVGRFTVTGRGDGELSLDLKGVIYKTTIVPSNTFLVVNVGQTEAKVEAIMNDFIQLQPDVNQVGDETVVEGTLEDFGFEVDNDVDGCAVPNGAPAPAEGEGEHEDDREKPKKKAPARTQGKKAGVGNAGKAKSKASGRGGAKKPRAKGKVAAKKPAKTKAARKPKAVKG
ncbi:hypothetical protein R1flu_006249 [Riccia fluitans]|uniref:DNA-binding protein BIN4 n=1 Tax=Riccia fluitans TaxID=41844 RepID=A0ABD1YVS4_9MARC